MSTPELHIATAFVFEGPNRITVTCEPNPSLGPRFVLVRGSAAIAWAVRSDVSASVASELDTLAQEEAPHTGDWQAPPRHDETYRSLLASDDVEFDAGPTFEFPAKLTASADIVTVSSERELEHNFHGWLPGEISGGRSPVMAIVDAGAPVSICFCARRTNKAAMAGVATADAHRGRGYAERVTAAWALALRSRRLTPLYSSSWSNEASLAVARKLGLITFGSTWTAS